MQTLLGGCRCGGLNQLLGGGGLDPDQNQGKNISNIPVAMAMPEGMTTLRTWLASQAKLFLGLAPR